MSIANFDFDIAKKENRQLYVVDTSFGKLKTIYPVKKTLWSNNMVVVLYADDDGEYLCMFDNMGYDHNKIGMKVLAMDSTLKMV